MNLEPPSPSLPTYTEGARTLPLTAPRSRSRDDTVSFLSVPLIADPGQVMSPKHTASRSTAETQHHHPKMGAPRPPPTVGIYF